MGLKSDKDSTKWLGDAFVEQQLLSDAILRMTGSRYLYDGLTSMNDQMIRLYDNAFNAYIDMGLVVGQALTPEQIAGLKDNIVWYVTDPKTGAMVPTLYLADKKKVLDSDSVIMGKDVTLNGGSVTNSGTIKGGNVQIYARGDINNVSGVIKAEDWLALNAGGNRQYLPGRFRRVL
ncbi:MAG: hypothetical protein LBI01_05965 [Elusimicrobium sp.]|jgi:filamentous hemagglutinin|nr:hypothetical protein [Elusimicrobium sp.]